MQLEEVYQDAQKQGARIYPWDIGFADAATIEIGGRYGIFIDFRRCQSMADFGWKLAHEVSHCATGCTHRLASSFDLIEKHEYKANRRQIETYLPLEELRKAMAKGYREPWQLAEVFNVPEEAICRALHYWTETREKSLAENNQEG